MMYVLLSVQGPCKRVLLVGALYCLQHAVPYWPGYYGQYGFCSVKSVECATGALCHWLPGSHDPTSVTKDQL